MIAYIQLFQRDSGTAGHGFASLTKIRACAVPSLIPVCPVKIERDRKVAANGTVELFCFLIFAGACPVVPSVPSKNKAK